MFTQLNRLIWKFIYLLGNLQLAILLLLTIASLSSLGTVIEQEKSLTFYETNYPIIKPIFGFIDSNFIIFLGLDHIYTTGWFLILLIIFGGSLLSCTLSRQFPALKLATLWQFFKQSKKFDKPGISFNLSNTSLNQFSYILRKRDYNVLQQGPYLYAYKGLIGKIGPILVHASIIFILLGSMTGSLFGFMVQELIPKGELFHLQNIITSGPFSYIRQDFEGYIYDFKIAYSEQGIVDQFYSDIRILDEKLNTRSRKTIFVNEPLRYDGMTFYQTDWNIVNVQANLSNKKVIDIPLQEINVSNNSRFWIGSLGEKTKILIVIQDLTGKYLLYTPTKDFLGEFEIGQKIFIDGTQIRIEKILPSTGLQVKSDPGIVLVYFGFSFLIFSVFLSYVSYFQVWATKKEDKLYVYGDTNRATYFFEKNVLNILDTLQTEIVKFETESKISGLDKN
jgi:cytochrome c biogenesis protein